MKDDSLVAGTFLGISMVALVVALGLLLGGTLSACARGESQEEQQQLAQAGRERLESWFADN